MAAHNTLGKDGEDAAVAYLERNGYVILHRNWRKNHLELDIVAVKDELLIVVEVKTRSNTEYIEPQDAVNWQKIRHIVVASATVPAIYLFFKNYFEQNLHKETKLGARLMNWFLILICIVVGVLLSMTLLHGMRG